MDVAAVNGSVADAHQFLICAEKHPGVFGKRKVFCTIHLNVGRDACTHIVQALCVNLVEVRCKILYVEVTLQIIVEFLIWVSFDGVFPMYGGDGHLKGNSFEGHHVAFVRSVPVANGNLVVTVEVDNVSVVELRNERAVFERCQYDGVAWGCRQRTGGTYIFVGVHAVEV